MKELVPMKTPMKTKQLVLTGIREVALMIKERM